MKKILVLLILLVCCDNTPTYYDNYNVEMSNNVFDVVIHTRYIISDTSLLIKIDDVKGISDLYIHSKYAICFNVGKAFDKSKVIKETIDIIHNHFKTIENRKLEL